MERVILKKISRLENLTFYVYIYAGGRLIRIRPKEQGKFMRKIKILAVVFGFMGLTSLHETSAANLQQPRTLYRRAYDLYLTTDFKSALGYANEAVAADPHWLRAYGLRASIEGYLGETNAAAKDAHWIINHIQKPLTQMRSGDLLAAGRAFEIREDPQAALEAFAEALSRGIKTSEVLAGRAAAYAALGGNGEALRDIDDALHIEPTPPLLYLYKKSAILYNEGRAQDALKTILPVLSRDKSFLGAYILLGKILAKHGDSWRATEAFKKASTINPDDDRPYLALAVLEFSQKKDTAALSNLDRAVQSAGGDYRPYVERAKALLAQGRSSKAIADYEKALKLYWIPPLEAIQIGDYFTRSKLEGKAMASYSKAVEESLCSYAPCSNSLVLSLMKRGAAYQSLKETKKALQDISLAIKMGPPSALPWIFRAQIERGLGENKRALADLDQAAGIDPKNISALLSRAALRAQLGRVQKSLGDFNAAISVDSSAAKAYNDRGIFYHSLHKLDLGLKDLLEATSLDPKSPIYQYNLGVIEYEDSLSLKALASFGSALRNGGPQVLILTARANVYSELGDRVNALKDIRAALAQNSKYAPAYDIEGLLNLRQNDGAEALNFFNRAVDMDDKNPTYWIHLGLDEGALGETKKAFYEFKKALELNSHSRQALTLMCKAQRLLKDPQKALPFCDQAISLDASYAPAYLERGLCHLALQEATLALNDLNRSIILGNRKSYADLAKAVAHVASHHYLQAHEDYEAATWLTPIAHAPDDGFAPLKNDQDGFYRALAEVLPLAGADENNPYLLLVKGDADANSIRLDQAITNYSKALDESPSNPIILAARGAAYVSDHLYDSARTDIESALKGNTQNSDLHLKMAAVLIIRKDYDGALGEALEALKLDPENARAYFFAGNARYFQGNFQKALDNYSLAVKKDPRDSNSFNGLGLGYFALGNYPRSIAAFSRAIALSPRAARYWRNRGAAYTKMGQYENATFDFKSAGFLNQNPDLNENYRKLIKQSEAMISRNAALSVKTK